MCEEEETLLEDPFDIEDKADGTSPTTRPPQSETKPGHETAAVAISEIVSPRAIDEAEEVANDFAGLRMEERLTTPAKREASKAQALPPEILSDLLHDIEAHKAAPKVDLPSVSVATPVFC